MSDRPGQDAHNVYKGETPVSPFFFAPCIFGAEQAHGPESQAKWGEAQYVNIGVTVLGGGSWGTTVAALVARNAETTIWARSSATVDGINRDHTKQPRAVTLVRKE